MQNFSDSSSDSQQTPQSPFHPVSILRHLPEPRKLMQAPFPNYPFSLYEQQTTKCVYQQPLSSLPSFVAPKKEKDKEKERGRFQGMQNCRLGKLEDVLYQYEGVRERVRGVIDGVGDRDRERLQGTTLWGVFSGQVPSYSRFGQTQKKSNFANILIPINGINISLPSKAPIPHAQLSTNPDTIRFDSHFQSGNLLYAYRNPNMSINTSNCSIQSYSLILQNDTNTKGHNQWFYFKVFNGKKNNRIRFQICNFVKDQSMFSYGIKPLVFSERDYSRHRIGWVRSGDRIEYKKNSFIRQSTPKPYYTLSFEYTFSELDTVYFAPTHPYTFTQLAASLNTLFSPSPSFPSSYPSYLSIKPLCQSIGKNMINILTYSTGKRDIEQCQIIWVLARQHPGESTGSFMVEGVMEYLAEVFGAECRKQGKETKWGFLDQIVFKIIPMINVDGVIHGNTRCELTGVDPNRMWKKPLRRLSPAISALKKLILEHKKNTKMVLDFHSHSKKLGCFFYGNSPLHNPNGPKLYPTLVCQKDQRFELKNCRFRGGYETTARNVLYQLGIENVYTVQCSLMGYMKKGRIVEYQVHDYHQMGKRLIEVFLTIQKKKRDQKGWEKGIEIGVIDRDDIQSARSQSSLSDDQYQQIRFKTKQKPKKKYKKIQPQPSIPLQQPQDPLKYFVKKTKNQVRPQLSLNQRKKRCHERQFSNNQLHSKINMPLNINTNTNINIGALNRYNLKQNSMNKCGTVVIKDNGNSSASGNGNGVRNRKYLENLQNQEKKNISSFQVGLEKNFMYRLKRQKENLPTQELPVYLEKQDIEVQANFPPDERYENPRKLSNKTKNQAPLCIVGSSLQDDLLNLAIVQGKSEVGIQIYQQTIQQATRIVEIQAMKKEKLGTKLLSKNGNIAINCKSKKIPKILNYLCSNLIGFQQQGSVWGQDRRLAPLGMRKSGNVNALNLNLTKP